MIHVRLLIGSIGRIGVGTTPLFATTIGSRRGNIRTHPLGSIDPIVALARWFVTNVAIAQTAKVGVIVGGIGIVGVVGIGSTEAID
jgi:hypothetical protein